MEYIDKKNRYFLYKLIIKCYIIDVIFLNFFNYNVIVIFFLEKYFLDCV